MIKLFDFKKESEQTEEAKELVLGLLYAAITFLCVQVVIYLSVLLSLE